MNNLIGKSAKFRTKIIPNGNEIDLYGDILDTVLVDGFTNYLVAEKGQLNKLHFIQYHKLQEIYEVKQEYSNK